MSSAVASSGALDSEVLRIAKKLDKIVKGDAEIPESSVMDLLKTLQEMPVSLDILQRSRIGLSVNAVRKGHWNQQIIQVAKQLIKQWKRLLDSSTSSSSGSQPNSQQRSTGSKLPLSETEMSNSPGGGGAGATAMLSRQNSNSNSNLGVADSPLDFCDSSSQSRTAMDDDSTDAVEQQQKDRRVRLPSPVPPTNDEIRLKCREMLLTSLKGPGLEIPDGTFDPDELADRIEDAIYKHFGRRTSDKYKASIRSRVFNLRDKKNPDLRLNVLTGAISSSQLALMTSEEMASAEMQRLRDKFTKQSIDEHQMAVDTGTPTDLFRCGKCRGKNCTYTQAQTRSADEPMTTFVWCQQCGNRWKFS